MPEALSRRNTLQVVCVANFDLPGMILCLAPSPAVMSHLAIRYTFFGSRTFSYIRFVFPSTTGGLANDALNSSVSVPVSIMVPFNDQYDATGSRIEGFSHVWSGENTTHRAEKGKA